MKNFYIFTNRAKDPHWTETRKIRNYIESKGCRCLTLEEDPQTKSTYKGKMPVRVPDKTDCIITLGGDGTLLQVARDTNEKQIPIIGINFGTLGYLTELNRDSYQSGLDALISGNYTIQKRMMIYGKIFREGKVIFKDTALNEILISREGNRKMIKLINYVNGVKLNSFKADGLIVSTATGSTGYSLSAGGPIISPDTALYLLRSLAPQTMVNRSIILPPDNEITVEIGPDKYGRNTLKAVAAFDGDARFDVISGDKIVIKRSNKDSLFAKVYNTSFLDVLYKKMSPEFDTEG